MLKIILTSLDEELKDAWEKYCGVHDCVEIVKGSILDVDCDAVISPANSYGYMDGGIDMVYSKHFGWDLQARLQTLIKDKHHGQLIVGSADIVETHDENIPYMIAGPTMRVPLSLYNSANPYLAMRAVLLLIKHGTFNEHRVSDLVTTIAVPGLGTGVGEIKADTCAKQVEFAIREVLFNGKEFPDSWLSAQTLHYDLVREN